MSEATRAWVYRLALLALVALVVVLRPDRFIEWMPYLTGFSAAGLATLNTSVKR